MSDQPPPIHVRDPDGNDVMVGGRTVAEQQSRLAATKAMWAATALRDGIVDKVHNVGDLIRAVNWDWLDHYCHEQVAQIQFVRDQSPNAGANDPAWGSLTTFAKAEALQLGVSYALVENLRMAQALDLIVDVLADLITAAKNVAPPPDR
jgi:hypothetical protein